MTKAMLDKLLSNSVPRAILLYGESEFLISYYANTIIKKINGNHETMYFGEYNHQDALNHLGVNSLFGGANVLVVKLYATLTKTQLKELFYILELNPQSFLILQLYKSPSISDVEYAKRFKNMSLLFKPTQKLESIYEVRFYQPSYDEAIRILQKRVNELHLPMNMDLLQYLFNLQNHDLSITYNELEKLIYYPQITQKLIDELSYNLGNMKLDSILNALFDKKGYLIQIMQILHEEGVENADVLRELNRYFYLLFKLYGHSKTHGNMDCKEALGYKPPPQILNIWSKRSLRLTNEKYLIIFDLLNQWRIAQFQGKNVALQYLIEIQRIL